MRESENHLAQRLVVANMRMVVALARHHCRVDKDLARPLMALTECS